MTEADLKEIETRYRAWQQKKVRHIDLEVCAEDVAALIKAIRAAWLVQSAGETTVAPREKPLTPDEARGRNYRMWGGNTPSAPDPFDDPVS